MVVQRRATPNFSVGRGGATPKGVVAHTTVGTFAGTVAWFGSRRSAVSAHYLVGLDGRVVQFVDEADTAQHAGRVLRPTAPLVEPNENPNRYTIGIEFEDSGEPFEVERTDEQYAAGGSLIAAAAARWGFPVNRDHVIGHRELFAAKGCPGNLDLSRLVREASDAA